MRVSIFLGALLSLVLSVFGAAIADPQRGPVPFADLDTVSDGHPLCGAFAWWNSNKWQEEELWEIRDCTKFYHNVGRVNMAGWGKCEICFFFP